MRLPLVSSFLVLSWLTISPVSAQIQFLGTFAPVSPSAYQRLMDAQTPPRTKMLRPMTVQPTIPVDPDGAIRTELDTAIQHLYARHKVRTVLKVKLDRQGNAQDTVLYQTVDEQGRWQQAGTGPATIQRQWSYNQAGQCTALVEYATPTRPYTIITTYNPALRRGQQEILQATGQRNVVSEKQLYSSGDTLLTDIRAQALLVEQVLYPDYHQRSIRLQPHPDTVLSLTCFYNPDDQPTSYQANYLFYRHGKLLESGKLNLNSTPLKARSTAAAAHRLPPMSVERVLATLREGNALQPHRRQYYDSHNRLTRQELTAKAGAQVLVQQEVRYTYNNLGQLIGREASQQHAISAARTAYIVYSYAPTGLLRGETNNTRGATPEFYRFEYQYYE